MVRISSIDVKKMIIAPFKSEQYVILIDNMPLNQYLIDNDEKSEDYFWLLPPIGMYDSVQQRYVKKIIKYKNINLPVLICSDDMDLSCIVVTVEVILNKKYVVWKNFQCAEGYISPRTLFFIFEIEQYEQFTQKMADFIDNELSYEQ